MQTTMRIDDSLYRRAKATAALQGVSLAVFFESALLEKMAAKKKQKRIHEVGRIASNPKIFKNPLSLKK